MFVPSYQMHNVLNVYSKHLRHNVTSAKNKSAPEEPQTDQVNLTPGGKREATIEKVSKDIIDKITQFGSADEKQHRINENAKINTDMETAAHKAQKTKFVFNVIDAINKKITNTLSVEDSSFLIQRFVQSSEDEEDKKTDAWV